MATSTTSHTPLESPDAPPRRWRALARAIVVVLVGLLLISAGTLIGLRFARAGSLPGITVEGIDVGGRSAADVRDRITLLAQRKGDAVIVAARDEEHHRGTARDLGYSLDIDTTVEQIMYRGRQGNPLVALADHLRAFRGALHLPALESVREKAVARWAKRAAVALEREPREGRLRFDGATIQAVQPRPGQTVDTGDLQEKATAVLLAGGGGIINVMTNETDPRTDAADVADVLGQAEKAVAKPVTLQRGDDRATLSPDDIGNLLATRATSDGTIRLRVKPSALTQTLGADTISAFEREPQSALFEVDGNSINLIKGHLGFSYNESKAAKQLLDVLTGGRGRTVTIAGDTQEPELSNAEARKLNIVERVSTFTTYHACCESRVTNIHRIADIVDDAVIKPGETFSVNGHVGERTADKGFVGGGAIFEGEFVEQIGGGVSQFATTTYNAAFFGGYEIVEHKTHSYYISRYPEGREATLNYPDVDLKIRNNSPHGMVLSTSYTGESITVSVYGKKWVEVGTTTGPRTNIKQPKTQYKENDDMPKGKEHVIQEAGAAGFDVTVTRTLKFPDGETRREEIFTRYLPQPRIIERNT
ncbi:MAG: hypothetical protein GEU74_12185 [Nitriliruptorales bacterium]|nr:hypothetical protein [Nitriliruptorales bacterium]